MPGMKGGPEDLATTRGEVRREVANHLSPPPKTDPLTQEALEAAGGTHFRSFMTSHPYEGKMEIICPPEETLGDTFKMPLKDQEGNDFVLGKAGARMINHLKK